MTTPAHPDPRPRHRRRSLLLILTVLVLGGAAVLDLAHPFGDSPTHPLGHANSDRPSDSGGADPASTSPVERRTLSSQTTVDATLGYAGTYPVTNQFVPTGAASAGSGAAAAPPANSSGSGQAVVTALPRPGQVIEQGQVLYEVDGQPVVMLYGATPAYRALAEGRDASDVTGADVQQLNADLVALGYATEADLDPSSDEFGAATAAAVKKLQDHLGLDQTGALDVGEVVFLPSAVRVSTVTAILGGSISKGSPVLTGTATTRQVAVDLDTSEQSEVKVGDQVTITLPNSRTTAGVVSSIGSVAAAATASGGQAGSSGGGSSDSAAGSGSGTGSGSAGGTSSGSGSGGGTSSGSGSSGDSTVEVDVRLSHPSAAQAWDQAPVQVTITTQTVHDALVVRVVALLAQAGGGYAVESVDPDGGRHLIPVSLGLFDDADGLVQVTGSGLAAGQRVVVPTL